MKRLGSYVLMAVGFAMLSVVAGIFTAGPAIAQAVRAALVSNVDDPGRIPYQVREFVSGNDCSFLACVGFETSVPAGKRLVITNISGRVSAAVPGGTLIELGISNKLIIPMTSSGSLAGYNYFGFDQPVRAFFDPGHGPFPILTIGAVGQANLTIFYSGYLLDCSTGPCAAIAP